MNKRGFVILLKGDVLRAITANIDEISTQLTTNTLTETALAAENKRDLSDLIFLRDKVTSEINLDFAEYLWLAELVTNWHEAIMLEELGIKS